MLDVEGFFCRRARTRSGQLGKSQYEDIGLMRKHQPVVLVSVTLATIGDTVTNDGERGSSLGNPSFNGTDEVPAS